jgi:DnaJ-class molecular chaperone
MTTHRHGAMHKHECFTCEGRGHVLNTALMWNPLNWFAALTEANDPNGRTRMKCLACDGRGFNETEDARHTSPEH